LKKLERIVAALKDAYGTLEPLPAKTAFELVLYENIGYLVGDERRRELFLELKKKIGTTPAKVLATPAKTLAAIAGKQVEKLHECATIALESKGDLGSKAVLKKFPSIGDPGAERILLLTGQQALLAVDSNGLRVLTRLGYGEETKNYSKTYRSAQSAAMKELPADAKLLARAHALLRHHGKELCKQTKPACFACPVERDCAFGRAHFPTGR
jgi:endonuclease III